MQEKGIPAYLAELIGTLLLVFFITSVVVLYVSVGGQAQFGSDFAVVGLVHAFLLFGLIVMFGVVSGGHFNPAVTLAALVIRRIRPLDGAIYILAQLIGGVLGAFLTKGLLLDEGRATNYGATAVSGLLAGDFAGNDQTVSDGVARAEDFRSQITLIQKTLPLSLAGLGVLLLIVGGLLLARSGRSEGGAHRDDEREPVESHPVPQVQ